MFQNLQDCLVGKIQNYHLPFLWLHGEPKERIREEIIAIRNSGIYEFCAESRPYEAFCQEPWWDDFEYILQTAKELGMRVWLLDDRKFPTGYANGYLASEDHVHLRKRLIREHQTTVIGPMRCVKIHAGGWLKHPTDKIIRVIAYRHCDSQEQLDFHSAMDLTSTLSDGMVYFDAPDGIWRVCTTVESTVFGRKNSLFQYYIDMLNPESCQAMINAVYEPHYQHFASYFGNVFAGFFSDEPGFFNSTGTFTGKLGIMQEAYPWRDDLPLLIARSAGVSEEDIQQNISALWEDLGEITPLIRTHYMEVVSKLYRDNFCKLLGNWCKEHGVSYIGHVIEEQGSHMRLGYGSGHYFRSQEYQNMAGVDVVLIEDIPGTASCHHRAAIADRGLSEPASFRYTVPKLASSCAHLQSNKNRQALCELFGAFGWAEGLPYMKGLADIMLGSGINRFVPHAFSPRTDDPDCPPHFYNGGKNVQYPLFKNLVEYMDRCTHLMENTIHCPDVAVFYNAEADWSGGKHQIFHAVCQTLTTSQIDFDIVPYDLLVEATVINGRMILNGESFGALIVSESQYLPFRCLQEFSRLAQTGLPVIFTESLCVQSAEARDIQNLIRHFSCVSLEQLPNYFREKKLCQLTARGSNLQELRFYHTQKDRIDIFLFSNEAIRKDVSAMLSICTKGPCLVYDPWYNQCYRLNPVGDKIPLNLEKGNLLYYIFGCDIPESTADYLVECSRDSLPLLFDISLMDEDSDQFQLYAKDSSLIDISSPNRLPFFSGQILYQTHFSCFDPAYCVLDLGEVGETAEVWLNGFFLGVRINAPYKYPLKEHLKKGENELKIIVRSNNGHRRRDSLSRYIQLPPSGILGDIFLCKYKPLEQSNDL